MFKNTYQSGFLSILYSIGSKPLQIWDKQVRNGHIKRITDSDIQSSVIELMGTNVSTNYITCPAGKCSSLFIMMLEQSIDTIPLHLSYIYIWCGWCIAPVICCCYSRKICLKRVYTDHVRAS
jgi:hypothetical protein